MKKTNLKIIAVFLLVLCIPGLSACGRFQAPEDAAEAFLSAMQQGRVKKASACLHNPDQFNLGADVASMKLNRGIFRHLSWELGDVTLDTENNYYAIDADITMADISEVMAQITDQYYDQMLADAVGGVTWEDDTLADSLKQDLTELLLAEDVALTTTCVQIYVVPTEDGSWQVFMTDELLNAVTGGVLDVYAFYADAEG